MLVLTDYWFPAGHLNYYLPPQFPEMPIGPLQHIHHFAWINGTRPILQKGEDALYIIVSNFYRPPGEPLSSSFASIDLPEKIAQWRSGKIVRYFYIYRLRQYQGGLPSNGLVGPGIRNHS